MGRRAGDVAFLVARKRARIGYANLTAALGSRYTPAERRRIIRRAFHQLAQGAVELLRLPLMDRDYVKRYITLNHFDRIASALQQGHGLIFLTSHFGNWELSSIVGGLVGYPVTALARIQQFPRLYRLLNRMREAKGCRVIAKGMAMRDLIKTLREGQIVGILSDQDAKEHGEYLPLFGRPASVAKGAVQLALETGAVILPTFIHRTRGAHHVIDLEPPLELPEGGDEAARIRAGLAQFVAHLERHVTEHPEQWLWMHKRWEARPEHHLAGEERRKAEAGEWVFDTREQCWRTKEGAVVEPEAR